jgi:Cu/Ag efflux protein CusF
MMDRTRTAVGLAGALALLFALAGVAGAQAPIKHEKEAVTIKATIELIDHDTRIVTFKHEDGTFEDVYCGPEVRRFDELKVGDKVTFRSTDAVVYQIRKPGEPGAPTATDTPAVVRNAGAKPGATITQQLTRTVLIKSVDAKVSAVTYETEEGRTRSIRVKDKNLLKGLAAGDRVVITYTNAVAISVE